MSQTVSFDKPKPLPRSLKPASLWRRAAVGLLALTIGVATSAWLLHASIDAQPPTASAEASAAARR